MKAFIALSFKDREELDSAITQIENALKKFGYNEVEVFVRRQTSSLVSSQEIMQAALQHITESQLVVAEISHKAVGIGIEVGHAYARHIPIIGIRRAGSVLSTTLEGVLAAPVIEYSSEEEIPHLLSDAIQSLSESNQEIRLKELNTHELALLDYVLDSSRSLLFEFNKTTHSKPSFNISDLTNEKEEEGKLLVLAREFCYGLNMGGNDTQLRFWRLLTSDLPPLETINEIDQIGLSRGESPFQIALMSVQLALGERMRNQYPNQQELLEGTAEIYSWLWNSETPRIKIDNEVRFLESIREKSLSDRSRRI